MSNAKSCENHQDLFVEALYNELDAAGQAQLSAHLDTCTHCKTAFEEMQGTLRIMDHRQGVPPDWQTFDRRLQAQLALEVAAPSGSESAAGHMIHRWALRASAAAAILIMGILIGKYWLAPQEPALLTTEMTTDTLLLGRTQDYLDQSKRLFLGIANMDAVAMESGLDLTRYRQASKTLVQESRGLRTALHDSRQKRLHRLVEDLEVILLQMANLEAEGDIREIEIIQDGLEQSGLLFKINMEALRQNLPPKAVQPRRQI